CCASAMLCVAFLNLFCHGCCHFVAQAALMLITSVLAACSFLLQGASHWCRVCMALRHACSSRVQFIGTTDH
ncbi:hypothetical protein COO60DRAFT_1516646, partial [Scenedesmus sp. NREL 46B-D3]